MELQGQWSKELSLIENLKLTELDLLMAYIRLYIDEDKICSNKYRKEYIFSTHPNKKIKATVVTVAIHLGDRIPTKKEITVNPGGIANRIELGCTGFDAGNLSHDTTYYRYVTDAVILS